MKNDCFHQTSYREEDHHCMCPASIALKNDSSIYFFMEYGCFVGTWEAQEVLSYNYLYELHNYTSNNCYIWSPGGLVLSKITVSVAQNIELFTHALSGTTVIFIPYKESKYRTVWLNTGHLATLLFYVNPSITYKSKRVLFPCVLFWC